MNKFLIVLCVSVLLLGGLAGAAEAYTVEARYFIDGVDLDTGNFHANPAVLLILVGSPDQIQQLLKPESWTLEFFEEWVDLYVEYDPAAGLYSIAVRNDEEETQVIGMAVLDSQTSLEHLDNILFDLIEEGFLSAKLDPGTEMVLLLTADGRYFLISDFMLGTWSISFTVDEVGRVIPEPGTVLLLGLGLLGLMGIRRWRRKGKGIMKLFLLLALAGGLFLSGAEPVAAQTAFTSCADVKGVSQPECEALVAFYDSTNGDSWNNNTNWKQTNTPCDWNGVRCYGGRLTFLGLWTNNLNGEIPDLSALTNLDTLNLGGNQLSGDILNLSALTNLKDLSLAYNQLSGDITAISKLINLQNIDLSNNELGGPLPDLSALTQLRNLNLSSNKLTGQIPDLSALTQLRNLNLSSNKLMDVSAISKLVNLENLDLSNNELEGPIPNLSMLTRLQDLSLLSNDLSGEIPDLSVLTELRFLDLSDNKLSGPIPDLRALTKLTGLFLYNNDLSGPIPDLRALTKLKWLYLSNNEFESIPNFNDLTETTLKFVTFSNNKLTGPIPDLSELIELASLDLSNNELEGPIPDFSVLTKLTRINLSNNKLTGNISASRLPPQLIDLLLNNNQLTGNLPSGLGQMINLNLFSLANNQLSGPLPADLIDIPTSVEDGDPKNDSGLQKFYFNGTNLCDPQDTEFQKWLNGIVFWDKKEQTSKQGWQGTGVACPFQVTDIPQGEANALVSLYMSTGGANWTNTTAPWLATGTSPCSWYGVTCSDGHVTELNLSSKGLSGNIPPEFGNLPQLQTLNLNNNNQLSGSLPANLTQLTALTAFYFRNTTLCEPQDETFQHWLYGDEEGGGIPDLQGTDMKCTSTVSTTWFDANKSASNPDDDDLCWAAAAANMLAWAGWNTTEYETSTAIFEKFQEHWENKKGSAQDAWNWWLTGAEPGEFGEYSEEWAHVDVAGGGGYWPAYDFNDWYEYSEDASDIKRLIEEGYGVTLTIASDLADPASVHAVNHAITVWGWEEYDEMITALWVTDSDDLAGELFRLQVMQAEDGTWYLSGGETAGFGYGTGEGTGYGTGEWYLDEIHALKSRRELVRITASTTGSGMIAPTGELQVAPECEQRFTLTPAPGSLFTSLLVDGVEKIGDCEEEPETGTFEYTLNVGTSDQTIEAVFQPASGTATITAIVEEDGHGSILPGTVTVTKGTSQTYTITPESGYTLTHLLVNDIEKVGDCPVSGSCEYTFANVASDYTIAASFQSSNQIVTIHAWAYEQVPDADPLLTSGGSITPTGNVRLQTGQDQTFTMVPESKYQFVDVYVKKPNETIWRSVRDAVVYDQPTRRYTFPGVSEDQEIKARFAKKEETIVEIQGRCLGPYGQVWDCSKVTQCVGEDGEEGEYKNGQCRVVGKDGVEVDGQEIDVNISVELDNAEYDLETGFRVSLSEAYGLFLEYQGSDFKAWEQCETHERFEDGVAYTEDTLCVSAALSFGPGHDCGN